jgi:hypothetical protein
MSTLHQGIYVGVSATILHGATSSCGSASCNTDAREKVTEQQNAVEHRLLGLQQPQQHHAALKIAIAKIGVCLFHSKINGLNLIFCQVNGCNKKLHHACQCECVC